MKCDGRKIKQHAQLNISIIPKRSEGKSNVFQLVFSAAGDASAPRANALAIAEDLEDDLSDEDLDGVGTGVMGMVKSARRTSMKIVGIEDAETTNHDKLVLQARRYL